MTKKTTTNKGKQATAQAAPKAVPTGETAPNIPPPEPTKKDPMQARFDSILLAEKIGKLTGKSRIAVESAIRFAEHLDLKMVFETPASIAPVDLTVDERVMLAAYRSGNYHVFGCVSDDLMEDEKKARELEIARGYKPIETRNASERDSDTFYTPLEMIAMDVVAYLAKGWIPRGVMFYDDNYIQMIFGVAETMLKSMIDDCAYLEMGNLALWLRYHEQLEAESDEPADDQESGDDE